MMPLLQVFGVIMVNKIQQFLLEHLTFLKIIIVAIMGLTAFFIAKDNVWYHWSWLAYAVLLCAYLGAELIQYKRDSLSPLDKVKNFLLDFDGWEETEENNWHYKDYPEFTISPTDEDCWEVEGSENWVRACTNPRAFVRPMQIKYFQTVLAKITCIYFDEMRGLIPAPKATFVNNSDQEYFWSVTGETIDFIFLQFLLRRNEDKILNEGLINPRMGKLPVAVFSSEDEKEKFLEIVKSLNLTPEDKHIFSMHKNDPLVTDHDRKIISYSRVIIEKLEDFRSSKV